jgi:hypothetical protein
MAGEIVNCSECHATDTEAFGHEDFCSFNEREPVSPTELELPEALIKELTRMRRDPAEFTGVVANCNWCGPEGKNIAIVLGHQDCAEAGKWCPTHGWWYFESPQIPPKGHFEAPKIKK